MKRYFMLAALFAVGLQMAVVNLPDARGAVTIQVVNEDGTPMNGTYFNVSFYSPLGDTLEVVTDSRGSFTIDDKYVGDKISIGSPDIHYGVKTSWEDVAANGVLIKCYNKSL